MYRYSVRASNAGGSSAFSNIVECTTVAPPSPSNTPPPGGGRIVFVTSTTRTGNLGGIAGAHAICQNEALANSLTGTFRAWISSNSTNDPESTFTRSTAPYFVWLGSTAPHWRQVANNWADLTDGALSSVINTTLAGNVVHNATWTATTTTGAAWGSSCAAWTSTGEHGLVGDTTVTDSRWSHHAEFGCHHNFHLFCFQQ